MYMSADKMAYSIGNGILNYAYRYKHIGLMTICKLYAIANLLLQVNNPITCILIYVTIVKERHETVMGYKLIRSARVVYSHNR